jgi:hypothetical protein
MIVIIVLIAYQYPALPFNPIRLSDKYEPSALIVNNAAF